MSSKESLSSQLLHSVLENKDISSDIPKKEGFYQLEIFLITCHNEWPSDKRYSQDVKAYFCHHELVSGSHKISS